MPNIKAIFKKAKDGNKRQKSQKRIDKEIKRLEKKKKSEMNPVKVKKIEAKINELKVTIPSEPKVKPKKTVPKKNFTGRFTEPNKQFKERKKIHRPVDRKKDVLKDDRVGLGDLILKALPHLPKSVIERLKKAIPKLRASMKRIRRGLLKLLILLKVKY